MSTPSEPVIITGPGLYDIPEDAYHADPVPGGSLSGTSAKYLLPPYCPAIYDHRRRHHRPPSAQMQLGTVVHSLILGTGQETVIIEAADWRGKPAQQQRDAATADGKLPILIADYRKAEAIAAAVKDDPDTGPLFDSGDAEQSMFWIDPESGVWCRGRIDWLTHFAVPTIVDVKTTADASPEKFAKSAAEYRYDMQDVHYRQGLGEILGCHWEDIDFLFCTVQTEEPYLVMTYRLEDEFGTDIANAAECCRIAREKFRDCTASGTWPKWSRDIHPLTLPAYARRQIERGINDYHGF